MAFRHRLDHGEKQELLRLARATLREYTRRGALPPARPQSESLQEAAGAFVTLRVRATGALRGCIGSQQEDLPLFRTVQDMTAAAASRDPRFPPVLPDEVDSLAIEISVLGDRRRVHRPEDVEIGRHGLTLWYHGRRGLLLPQVAPENGWNAETFLARVCAKAGLPDDTWRSPDARVETFTAQVFGEEALSATHPAL